MNQYGLVSETTQIINNYLYNSDFTGSFMTYDEINNIITKNVNTNNILYVGYKIISKNSIDAITFEPIKNGDILVDFLRDTKTEYEYCTYYKETTLQFIVQTNKNPFTMKPLDKNSIVKYTAIVP